MTGRPDRGAWSGPVAAVSFIAGLAGAMRLATSPFPHPGASGAELRTYFHGNPRAVRVNVTGQFVSAAALARFTLSVARLARRSGSPQLAAVAGAGGALAVTALGTAAATQGSLPDPRHGADERITALTRRVFVVGGPVHGIGFGLLTGALGIAGRRTGEVPAPVAGLAIGAAAAGLACPLYFLWEPAGWLIPAGRFGGLIAAGIAGARIATHPDPT